MRRSTILKYALHFAIVLGLLLAGMKYLNGDEIFKAFQEFEYVYIPAMLALSAISLLLKGWRFNYLMRPVSELRLWTVIKGYISGQSATLLPGGVAARAGLMHQVGVPVGKSGVPVAFSSLLDQAVFIPGAIVAGLIHIPARPYILGVLAVMAVAGALLWVDVVRAWLFRGADWLATRWNFEDEWGQFRVSWGDVARQDILFPAYLLSLIAFVMPVITFDLTLRGIGEQLSYPTLLLVFVLPTLLGRISALPGGVGITEAGMVGFLNTATPLDTNVATAAVAIFRVATVVFETLLGALFYFLAWRGEVQCARAGSP